MSTATQAYKRRRYGTRCDGCSLWAKIDAEAMCARCLQTRGLRLCRGPCSRLLPLALKFHGRRRTCKDCERSDRLANKDRAWIAHLWRQYKLRVPQYEAMAAAQGGVCAICRRPPDKTKSHWRLAVDHDHITGRIRGLLCSDCNSGLAYFKDSPQNLQLAISYLTPTPAPICSDP